ncbi:hypothetical protein LJR074_001994 [Acidovorax sp. LjRoot74]|uniref:hypothetical protein n=1 Tax=Acidovorax sp. LjRoot74 TaxID=3342337 RepID=UPI003ECE9E00
MSITVFVDRKLSEAAVKEVEHLARHLEERDPNWEGRLIWVKRGPATFVADTEDPLRGALLELQVTALLAGS